MTTKDLLLAEFDHEIGTARKTVERIPPDKFSYKPHDKSMSMIQLAHHVATMPEWARVTFSSDFFDMAAPFERPQLPTTTEELVSIFDKNLVAGRAAIESATEDQMKQSWSLRHGDHVIFSMPKSEVIRTLVMNHMIHHRGQLSVYLRMNDIPVPSIYGPSADES